MNACTRYLTHAMSITFFDQYFSSLVAKHWTSCSGPGFDSWLKYMIYLSEKRPKFSLPTITTIMTGVPLTIPPKKEKKNANRQI